jgi:hypothetical protein
MTKKLTDYQTKRNFEKTSGRAERPQSDRLIIPVSSTKCTPHSSSLRSAPRTERRFQIVGRHQRTSLNPQDERLAAEVEDHPLDYGDFERDPVHEWRATMPPQPFARTPLVRLTSLWFISS